MALGPVRQFAASDPESLRIAEGLLEATLASDPALVDRALFGAVLGAIDDW